MELLVILFFFGLSAAVIAKIKGSSFFIWFIVGFCLPFFGTLAALAMSFQRETVLRRCPECRALVPIEDQVCMRCGRDLDYPERPPSHAAPPQQERLFEG